MKNEMVSKRKRECSRKQRQRKEPGYEVVGLATFGGRTSLSSTPRRVALVRPRWRPPEAAGRHENGGTHLHHAAAEQQAAAQQAPMNSGFKSLFGTFDLNFITIVLQTVDHGTHTHQQALKESLEKLETVDFRSNLHILFHL